jgi:thioester reductase-like protein
MDEVQTWLVDYLADVLVLDPDELDPKTPLQDYGLDSSAAVVLTGDLEEWLERELDPTLLMDYGTIASLAQYLVQGEAVKTGGETPEPEAVDLEAEAILDPQIRVADLPEPSKSLTSPKTLFLTGATGFFGAFLLRDLLSQTQADCYCLVRGNDPTTAQQRIIDNLAHYQLWQPEFAPRIKPLLGDLAQPLLGLDPQQFQTLATEVDGIYHNAAFLHYVSSYHQLKPMNVVATAEILKLAARTKPKPVHYISSIGVFGPDLEPVDDLAQKTIHRETDLSNPKNLYLGYFQTKWVADKLVTLARSRGLVTNVYRLPFIAGDSQTGIWNTDDFVCRLIKGHIQMGTMPELDCPLELAPVDYLSRSVVYLSQQPEHRNQCFHFNHCQPLSWNQVYAYLQALGYPITQVSYPTWQDQLGDNCQSPDNAVFPLLPFLRKRWTTQKLTFPELYHCSRSPQIDCQNTVRALAPSGIVQPQMDQALLNLYFSYFYQSDFLVPIEATPEATPT